MQYEHIIYVPVKSHGFAVSLASLAMKSRSHVDHVISHAFQLKRNTYTSIKSNILLYISEIPGYLVNKL